MYHAAESSFASVTGEKLQKLTWYPQGEPKAVVQLVHGMAEHMGRYEEVGVALAKAGYLALGHTHLGHGKNARILGYFGDDGWDALLKDIGALRRHTQKKYPGVPYFILGHSMGSFLTRCYLMDNHTGLAGAVISGTGYYSGGLTALGLMLSNLLIAMGYGNKPARLIDTLAFSSGNKQFADAKTPNDWLSRDEYQVRCYIDDPLCGFVFTAQGYRDLFTGLKRLSMPLAAQKVDKELPIYFLSGGQDPIGQNGKGVMRVANQFITGGNQKVTVKLYPGGRHEMFHETNREEVFHDLIGWLNGELEKETAKL